MNQGATQSKTSCIVDLQMQIQKHFYISSLQVEKDRVAQTTRQRTLQGLNRLAKTHDHLVIATDIGPSFRHVLYKDYKGKRQEKPPELQEAVKQIHEALMDSDHRITACPGYEADDMIALLSRRSSEAGHQVTILSNDMDLCGLTRLNGVKMRRKETLQDQKELEEELGFDPGRMVLFKTLAGDSSDNIPGLRGVGKVGAKSVVKRHRNLENMLRSWPELPEKIRSAIDRHGEAQLYFWEHLTTLREPPHAYRVSQSILKEGKKGEQAKEIASMWKGWTPAEKASTSC